MASEKTLKQKKSKTIKKQLRKPKEYIQKVKPDTIKERKAYKEKLLEKFKEFNDNGKLTIAFFCDTFYPIIDGVIGVLNNYANLLSERCNVVVVVPKHKGKTFTKNYTVVGVASAYFKFVNYDLAFPELDADLPALLKNLRIDIIHSHTPFNMGIYANKLAKKRKIPIVFTFHSQYKRDFYSATKNEFLTSVLLKNIMKEYNKATETWTMHTNALTTLLSYGYMGNYYLIENATQYEYPENAGQLLNKVNSFFGLNKDETVFLFVGRIVKQKNILFIVESLKILKEKNKQFKMFFVGNGPDEDALKEKIQECGLEENIIVTGRLEDIDLLVGLYIRADLFLFPSMYDMSSIVQLEAAAHKTPTLFLNGSVTSCNIEDGFNGFIARATPNAYANKIIKIISNKKKLKEVSQCVYDYLYIKWQDVIDKAYNRYIYLIEKNKEQLKNKEQEKLKKKLKNKEKIKK